MPSSDLSRLKVVLAMARQEKRRAPGSAWSFLAGKPQDACLTSGACSTMIVNNNTAKAGWTCSNASLLCADLDLDLHAVVA